MHQYLMPFYEVCVINVTNLKKLRNYLEKYVTQDKFDMGDFRSKTLDVDTSCSFTTKNICGTIGCALGWAPFVKGLEPEPVEFYPGGFFGIPELCFFHIPNAFLILQTVMILGISYLVMSGKTMITV